MNLGITVSEAKELIKGIQEQPEHFFGMFRFLIIQESVEALSFIADEHRLERLFSL